MFHVCVAKFDVINNKKFLDSDGTKPNSRRTSNKGNQVHCVKTSCPSFQTQKV
jgi:hypothetical protein